MLVLSACGSTTQHTNTIAENGLSADVQDDGLSLSDPGTGAEEFDRRPGVSERDATSSGARETTSTDAPGTRGAQVGTRGAPGTPGTPDAIPTPTPTRGRGFTAKEIFVGMGTQQDSDKAMARFGLPLTSGDQEGAAKAIVQDVNQRGGVAGRKIVLVFYDHKAGSGADAGAQAACERWTKDRPVLAAINANGVTDNLESCMVKRQTPLLRDVHRPKSLYAGNPPYLYGPRSTTFSDEVPVLMRRLTANGYFGGWDNLNGRPGAAEVKIGVLFNGDRGTAWRGVVRQELARHGRSVAAEYEWSARDEMNQAVFQFRDAGVTHVIGFDASYLLFLPPAASQHYMPRYSMDTSNNPAVLQQVATEGQLAGAMGIGWRQHGDVDSDRDPGESAAAARCRKILQEAGVDTRNRTALGQMLSTCDSFNVLFTAIEKGGLSPAGIHRGVEAMRSMPSASTFRMAFPGGRPYGAAAARDLVFRSKCECFAYPNRTNRSM